MDTVEEISRYKAVYITMFYELRCFDADDKFNRMTLNYMK